MNLSCGRATGVLAGADDERAFRGDEALAGSDRVLHELGRRAVHPQAAAQRRANSAGGGRRGMVGAGGMRGGHQWSDSLARVITSRVDRPRVMRALAGHRRSRLPQSRRAGLYTGPSLEVALGWREGCARAPPAVPFAARGAHRLDDCRPTARSIAAQLKSAYQEWQRDRPVEATTTYRRDAGKVPIPGRSSCEIRELFGAPSKRSGSSVRTGPRAAPRRERPETTP